MHKLVEGCRAAKRWRTTDVSLRAMYVVLPYTIQTSAKERRPFLFLRNKLRIARGSLVHSAIVAFWMWILTAQTMVVYLKCNNWFLTTLDAQHTEPIRARSPFWDRTWIQRHYIAHSALVRREKKNYPKVQHPVNCIILSLVVCLTLHFVINKIN